MGLRQNGAPPRNAICKRGRPRSEQHAPTAQRTQPAVASALLISNGHAPCRCGLLHFYGLSSADC
jgi:hypothetical protein